MTYTLEDRCLNEFLDSLNLSGFKVAEDNVTINYRKDVISFKCPIVWEDTKLDIEYVYCNATIQKFTYWYVVAYGVRLLGYSLDDLLSKLPPIKEQYDDWSKTHTIPDNYDWKEGLYDLGNHEILITTQIINTVTVRYKDGTRKTTKYIDNVDPTQLNVLRQNHDL